MRTMQSTILLCWLGIKVLLLAALRAAIFYCFGWPDLLHPGGFAYQRWKAEVFDPYPGNRVVGPDGSRTGRPTGVVRNSRLRSRDRNSGTITGTLRNRFGPLAAESQSPVDAA